MKNVKFGVFCLGLVIAVAAVVSSLSAQSGSRSQPRPGPTGTSWCSTAAARSSA